MMAVAVQTKPSLTVGKPVLLFEGKYAAGYDLSSDGQRFLMVKQNEGQSVPQQINVVLGWFDELTRKVPAGKRR